MRLATSLGAGMRVYLRKWDPDYRLLGLAIDVPLGAKPRSFEYVIPATQEEPRSLLIFELPLASEVVWLDNVPVGAGGCNGGTVGTTGFGWR